MFYGTYYHKLEGKNRVSLPATFRKQLKKKVILTRGLDGCLFLFDEQNWQQEVKKAEGLDYNKRLNRDFVRLLMNEASEIELDDQGRILIPESHKQKADLGKEVVIVGSLGRIEIWNQQKYHKLLEGLEQTAESIAEQIGNQGNDKHNAHTSITE